MKTEVIRRIIRRRNYGFLKLINEYEKEIRAATLNKADILELIREYGKNPYSQTESLQDVFDALNLRINRFIQKSAQRLKQAMQHGARKVLTQKGEPLQIKVPKYDTQVQALVQQNLRYVQKITTLQRDIIIRKLSDAIRQGKTYREVAKDIVAEASAIPYTKAKLIATTEISRAHVLAQQRVFRENNISKYKWLTAGDVNVCDRCKANDGKIFIVGQGPLPVENTHPRCRCVTVAYVR